MAPTKPAMTETEKQQKIGFAASLRFLAATKQAPMTKETLAAYWIILNREPLATVAEACKVLASRPKPEFGPSMPEAAAILAECRRIRAQDEQGEPLRRALAWEMEKNLRLASGDPDANLVPVTKLTRHHDFQSACAMPGTRPKREVRELSEEEHAERINRLKAQAAELTGGKTA